MIVEIDFADGLKRFFKTDDYRASGYKEFYADCIKIKIMTDNGKKLKSFKRPFCWWYKHFTFKTEKVQKILRDQIDNLKEEDKEKNK